MIRKKKQDFDRYTKLKEYLALLSENRDYLAATLGDAVGVDRGVLFFQLIGGDPFIVQSSFGHILRIGVSFCK